MCVHAKFGFCLFAAIAAAELSDGSCPFVGLTGLGQLPAVDS